MLSNHNGISEYLQLTSIHKSSGFWAFAVKAGVWHSLAWQGEQAWWSCSPDWLHGWARASLSQFLLPSNYLCQSYIVLQKMSSRGKAWDDCPELSFSRACVTVPFCESISVSAPKLSVTVSLLNYILWSASSVWEKCSPLALFHASILSRNTEH